MKHWNTLWLGKNTVNGWESNARWLTQKSRWKLHVPQLPFPPERRNGVTAGLGLCRDVEMMLDFAQCSQLHFCTVLINCSIAKALMMFSSWRDREACAFLHLFFVLKKCLKIFSEGVFLLKWIRVFNRGEKISSPLEYTGTTHPQPRTSEMHGRNFNVCRLHPQLDYDKVY